MAPRLAVVVSQSPMRDARVADIEESIVAELIMVGGLDATLVGPLERILPDSTDLLCLSGFTQDLALLSWMPTEDAARLWTGLQLTGTVVPMSLDGSAAVPVTQIPTIPIPTTPIPTTPIPTTPIPGRRIFYIQLTAQSVPTQVCKQLKARLELLRVQPVSLQLKMTSPLKNLTTDRPAVTKAPQQPRVPLEETTPKPLATTPAPKLSTVSASSDSQWKSLDKLVDELDLLDL